MARKSFFVLVPAALLAACASSPDVLPAVPNYAEIETQPAPAHAAHYANCIGQAILKPSYRRASDGGDELLLFTCTGRIAEMMFEALGPWSAKIGSEWQADGRIWRSTAKVERNLIGVDYCSATTNGADARCVITFNAGDFLDQ